jgi:hypothetical protein
MRDIAFAAQISHLEELKQNDTSFNRTAVGVFRKTTGDLRLFESKANRIID